MTLGGEGRPRDMALKSIKIAGELGKTIWDITGNCGIIEIAGGLSETTWDIAGNCGTIKIAGGLDKTTWNIAGNCGTIGIADSNADFTADIAGSVGTLNAVGNKKLDIPSVLSGTWSFDSVKTIVAAEISECNLTAALEIDANKPAIGRITATGWISGCIIETTGDAGSIISGGIRDSSIWGGTDGNSIYKLNSLGRLQIKGIKGEAYCLINSDITAEHIGNAYLAYPKTFNSGTPFGLTAGSIDMLTIEDSTSTQTWKNLADPADTVTIEDLVIRLE